MRCCVLAREVVGSCCCGSRPREAGHTWVLTTSSAERTLQIQIQEKLSSLPVPLHYRKQLLMRTVLFSYTLCLLVTKAPRRASVSDRAP